MSRLTFGVLVALVGAAAARAAPPVCVDSGPLFGVAVSGDRITFCVESDARGSDRDPYPCYALADGKFSAAASVPAGSDGHPPARPAVAGAATAEVKGAVVQVCKGNCKTWKPRLKPTAKRKLMAAVNDDATLAAAWLDWPCGEDDGAAATSVEIYDVVKAKRLATFKAGSHDEPIVSVSFAGDAAVVHEGEVMCIAGSYKTSLVSKLGGKLGAVGGKGPFASGSAVHLTGTLWAFSSTNGDAVVVQDVKTGKLDRRIKLPDPSRADDFCSLHGDAARLVLACSRIDDVADVRVIDLASADKITDYRPAKCAPKR